MADDLEDLKARVAAARARLSHDVDVAQKVELRLNDLARIVEGSLARQSAELETAQAQIATLDIDLGRALARAEQAAGDAARADILAKENGELRSMVMTLLDVIEGRQKSSLTTVMQQLEENVAALITPEVPAALPAAQAESEQMPDDVTIQDEPESEPVLEFELAQEEEPAKEIVPDAKPAEEAAPMEDLSEIALYDAAEEVVEPDKN